MMTAMPSSILLNLSALIALVPASVWTIRDRAARPGVVFCAVVSAALAGPLAVSLAHIGGAWQTGLSLALWLSITASMAIFIALSLSLREVWRLGPLLVPYLLLLGALATIWSNVPGAGAPVGAVDAWLVVHIGVSLATYGLCTLAAVASVAVTLQERALKHKRPTALTHRLPSISDASRLQVNLLGASEVVLAMGIATGMAEQYMRNGQLMEFSHKTLLSILAFAVIGLLLILHQRTGLRGQRAARLILLAYLLLTLAYPGVKFVTDVLMA
jgi:ABC-type uncharacterized transport system permease subunit